MTERQIETSWVALTLEHPDRVELDSQDPEVSHALRTFADQDNRVLRVIYNGTSEPVRIISVYFDRGMKGQL